jgi:hypothetical protein
MISPVHNIQYRLPYPGIIIGEGKEKCQQKEKEQH